MGKRKVSNSNTTPNKSTKKVKKASLTPEQNGMHKLDFSSCESVMESLLSPNKLHDFLDRNWEKKPLYIKREELTYYGDMFTLASMKQMLSDHSLDFESDVNVCRYVNGEKELLNSDGQVTVDACETLMTDKQATFQLHQPQRYSDVLWHLLEKLETYFGCLVGSNVYITPTDSQGLAPHCDDIEVFVLQLEGSKAWKLYKPMVELSRDYTQDLAQEDIGDPIMEETLMPGDLLYFPRGTIHQAKTVGDGHSTHITISTYQQNTWGDFMNTAISQAIENALEDDVTIRSGLPINYLSVLGTAKNMSQYVEDKNKRFSSNSGDDKVKEFKERIKEKLAKLIDHIDVNTAADSMSEDFMASRLPPYGHYVKEEELNEVKSPTLESEIKLRYSDHVRIVYHDEEDDTKEDDVTIFEDESDSDEEENADSVDGKEKKSTKPPGSVKRQGKKTSKTSVDEDEDDEDDEDALVNDIQPCIKILHSLNNSQQLHMSTEVPSDIGALKFPVHFAQAISEVVNSKEFIAVKDLPLEEDSEKLLLATSLYSDDLIVIQ